MSSEVGCLSGALLLRLKTVKHPPSQRKPQAQVQAPRPPKPPHIQKVSGSIPPASSPVLLFLLAVGCELLAVDFLVLLLLWLSLLLLVVAAVAVAFGGASRHAAGNGVSA